MTHMCVYVCAWLCVCVHVCVYLCVLRQCLTVWSTPWRTCWTSSSFTSSSCSSLPSSQFNSSKANSSTAQTSPRVWRKTASWSNPPTPPLPPPTHAFSYFNNFLSVKVGVSVPVSTQLYSCRHVFQRPVLGLWQRWGSCHAQRVEKIWVPLWQCAVGLLDPLHCFNRRGLANVSASDWLVIFTIQYHRMKWWKIFWWSKTTQDFTQ